MRGGATAVCKLNMRRWVMVAVSEILSQVRRFLSEAKGELKKVTWPTRKQAVASTAVVIVVVVIVSIFLSIVDFGLAKIIRMVLG